MKEFINEMNPFSWDIPTFGKGVTKMNDKHPLESVFTAAIEQAVNGKGTRHGGGLTPFLEQPWAHYYELHGRGFLTGQAAKKLEEAASLRHGPEFESEAIGAMVYIAMAILKEREKTLNNC